MRVYLDTNIIYGFFKSLVISWEERRKHTLPSVIKFFSSRRDFTIFSSILVRCEIARRLRLDYNLSEMDIERMWRYLKNLLKLRMIDEILIDDALLVFIKRNRFRSRINNIIHLFLCRNMGLTLITGDNKLMEDGKEAYSRIIDYPHLRKKY